MKFNHNYYFILPICLLVVGTIGLLVYPKHKTEVSKIEGHKVEFALNDYLDAVRRSHPNSLKICDGGNKETYLIYYFQPKNENGILISGDSEDAHRGWYSVHISDFRISPNYKLYNLPAKDSDWISVYPDTTGLICLDTKS